MKLQLAITPLELSHIVASIETRSLWLKRNVAGSHDEVKELQSLKDKLLLRKEYIFETVNETVNEQENVK